MLKRATVNGRGESEEKRLTQLCGPLRMGFQLIGTSSTLDVLPDAS